VRHTHYFTLYPVENYHGTAAGGNIGGAYPVKTKRGGQRTRRHGRGSPIANSRNRIAPPESYIGIRADRFAPSTPR
jgi:hypothetical protein